MRNIFVLLFLCAVGISSSYAYDTWADINSYLSYDNIEIRGNYSLVACGTIKNKTGDHVNMSADMLFTNRFGVINKTQVGLSIPPYGSKDFCGALQKNNYRDTEDALFIEWKFHTLNIGNKRVAFK